MIEIYTKDMLINTKLSIPYLGNMLLKRKRLIHKLSMYEGYRLIMITAPAGYGKTALISSWLGQEKNKNIAWLALDQEDNEEELFWSYFLLSFYGKPWIPAEMRERADAMFRHRVPFNQLYLTYFINDVINLKMQVIMVLDDFGLIHDEGILRKLDFLIGHLPSNLHLVLSARERAEAGSAKLKALGSVLTLTREELCFTPGETALFFRKAAQVELSHDDHAKVCDVFEGWAAGLQMMALSIKEQEELKFPVPHKDHPITSYMLEEVIGGLSDAIIKFLMETSVFEQFCPQLCDFLFEGENSRRMIGELEHLNLFLICVDRQEEWYRYHSLFREFLENMLKEREGGMPLFLYRKAAQWYGSKDSIKEAVTYAIKGEDFQKAVLLIKDFGRRIGCKGQSGLLHKWNGLLPEHIVRKEPRLLLNSAWAYSAAGKLPEMKQCIQSLKETGSLSPLLGAEVTALCSSNLSGEDSELERMLTECGQALQVLSPTSFLAQLISFNMGGIFLLKGCLEEGQYYFRQCYGKSLETGRSYLTVISLKALITYKIRQGLLQKAQEELLGILNAADRPGGEVLPVMGILYAELAEIYYQRNDLEEALIAAEKGCSLGEIGEDIWSAEENYLILEKIYHAMNDQEGYERIKTKAMLCLEGRKHFDINMKIQCYHAQMLIQEEKLTLASRQIVRIEKDLDPKLMIVYPEFTFLKARFCMYKKKYDISIEMLRSLKELAGARGQNGLLCEALVLLSVMLERMGDSPQALRELEQAAVLAQEQDKVRTFLNEGGIMKGMLKGLVGKKKADRVENSFVEMLLDSFRIDPESKLQKSEELLSIREREVLKLVSQGADNGEIADQLFITLNTVKTHLLHIYTKLDVHSRQKAAAKAKTLNIIS